MHALNDRIDYVRDADVLQALRDHLARDGYVPSIRELGRILGLRSTSTIHYHLTNLARTGQIRWDKGKNRAIQILADAPDVGGLRGMVGGPAMTDSGVSVARTFAGRQDAALRICHELRDGLDCLALVLAEMAELYPISGYNASSSCGSNARVSPLGARRNPL